MYRTWYPGIWNLFEEIGATEQRQEILDWYHLKENLYKVGGSALRLKQAESLLRSREVNQVIAILAGVINFLPHPSPPRSRGPGVRNSQMI